MNKNFPKIQMPGGLPGGGCLSFDLTGTLQGKLQARQAILFHFKQALRAVFFTLSERLGITEADAKLSRPR